MSMRTKGELYNLFKNWHGRGLLNQNESVDLKDYGAFSEMGKFSYTTIRQGNKLIENYVPVSIWCLRILPEKTVDHIFDCLLEEMRAYALRECGASP